MDTQIRPLVVAPAFAERRPTLSLPASHKPAFAASASSIASPAPGLRESILRCAAEAQVDEKHDTDARLHCFIAKLSGCMESMGETELDHVLWDLMKTEPDKAKGGSAYLIDGASGQPARA